MQAFGLSGRADYASSGHGRSHRVRSNADGESGRSSPLRWKTDPSRDGGRDRRVGGRDGRDGPRDCAGVGPGQPAPTGDERPPGSAACSRRGRDRTPCRWRTGSCSVGRSSGVAAGPRRRSAQGELRLDSQREPWHNCSDRLGLVGARGGHEGPAAKHRALTPRLRPLPTLSQRTAARHASPEAVDADTPVDANNRAHRRLQNRADAVSHSDHSHHLLLPRP